ncbi:MAG: DUF2974 domain-containing protein [Synergistaceae bacterium]|nr:DUF2974 domain-containing protein [Synergistaceae bacterium]
MLQIQEKSPTPFGESIKDIDALNSEMIDAEVLAHLAYMPFGEKDLPGFTNHPDALESYNGMTVGELVDYYISTISGNRVFSARFKGDEYEANIKFLESVKSCPRYADLYILETFCKMEDNVAYPLGGTQSAAYVFSTCPKPNTIEGNAAIGSIYIAYRGTDATLNGWKEDLVMGYCEPQATVDQRYFTNYVFQEYKNADVRMTAHSKSTFSELLIASELAERYPKRIKSVFALDGPGFPNSMFDKANKSFEYIKDITYFICPENSIIGQIGSMPAKAPKEHIIFVKSEANDVMFEHLILNWRFSSTTKYKLIDYAWRGGYELDGIAAGKQSEFSKLVNNIFSVIQNNYPENKMDLLGSSVFRFLGESNSNSVWTWDLDNPQDVRSFKDNIIRAFGSLTNEEIEAITLFVKVIADAQIRDATGNPLSISKKINLVLEAFTGGKLNFGQNRLLDIFGLILAALDFKTFGNSSRVLKNITADTAGFAGLLLKILRDDAQFGENSTLIAPLLNNELNEYSAIEALINALHRYSMSNDLGVFEENLFAALIEYHVFQKVPEATSPSVKLELLRDITAKVFEGNIELSKIIDAANEMLWGQLNSESLKIITELINSINTGTGGIHVKTPEGQSDIYLDAYESNYNQIQILYAYFNILKEEGYKEISLANRVFGLFSYDILKREGDKKITVAYVIFENIKKIGIDAMNRVNEAAQGGEKCMYSDYLTAEMYWKISETTQFPIDKRADIFLDPPQSSLVGIEPKYHSFTELQVKTVKQPEATTPKINYSTDSFAASSGSLEKYSLAGFGSNKISVNFGQMRKARATVEDLQNEIQSRVKITVKVREMANEAKRQYSQYYYVQKDADDVMKACEKLEADTRKVAEELRKMGYGLGKVVEGYIELERELSQL